MGQMDKKFTEMLKEQKHVDPKLIEFVEVNAGDQTTPPTPVKRDSTIWLGQVEVRGIIRDLPENRLEEIIELCDDKLYDLIRAAVSQFVDDNKAMFVDLSIEVNS